MSAIKIISTVTVFSVSIDDDNKISPNILKRYDLLDNGLLVTIPEEENLSESPITEKLLADIAKSNQFSYGEGWSAVETIVKKNDTIVARTTFVFSPENTLRFCDDRNMLTYRAHVYIGIMTHLIKSMASNIEEQT